MAEVRQSRDERRLASSKVGVDKWLSPYEPDPKRLTHTYTNTPEGISQTLVPAHVKHARPPLSHSGHTRYKNRYSVPLSHLSLCSAWTRQAPASLILVKRNLAQRQRRGNVQADTACTAKHNLRNTSVGVGAACDTNRGPYWQVCSGIKSSSRARKLYFRKFFLHKHFCLPTKTTRMKLTRQLPRQYTSRVHSISCADVWAVFRSGHNFPPLPTQNATLLSALVAYGTQFVFTGPSPFFF